MQRLIAMLMSVFMTLLSFFGITPKTDANIPVYYDGDDLVTVLVEMKAAPLLEGITTAAQREQLIETLDSNETYQAMQKAHASLREKIEAALSFADFASSYNYVFVMNGFSLLLPYHLIPKLEQMDGVKSVHVSASFEAPVAPKTVLPLDPFGSNRHDGDKFSGIRDLHDAGYTGAGSVVAILDTGFQVDHEAFAQGVASPTYSKADIVAKSTLGFLNTIVPMFGTQYYSEKIPYRWDYAGVDKNVYNGDNTHGTHVAGIVGGNSDVLLGAAPDAQLLLMKVFKDGANSLAQEYVILAALEDCVKLKADVVNLSLGSESGQEPDNIFTQIVVNRLRRAAINVVSSAGNEESLASFDAVAGTPMNADLFDYGTTNSPASYSYFLSVASARVNYREAEKANVISVPGEGSLEISSFSAWGPTADLRLKPEIVAIGSEVYSAYNGNTYDYMGGTSMSSPVVAGAAAVLRQYLEQNGGRAKNSKIGEYVNALLMSTATPFKGIDDDALYSPRRQGAGFLNLTGAAQTPAYLTQKDGVSRPKIELGELTDGTLPLEFQIHNRSDKTLTYALSQKVLMDKHRKDGDHDNNLIESQEVGPKKYEVLSLEGADENGLVTLDAGKSKTIKLTLRVSDELIEQYKEAFKNGFFIDGFVFLTDPAGENVTLSIPFMGFLGDWEKDMLFDNTIYDAQAPYLNGEWGLAVTDGKEYYPLGANLFESGKETNIDRKYCAYSTNALGMSKPYVTVAIGLLRNAKRMDFNLFTDNGIFRYCGSTLLDYCRKTVNHSWVNHGVLWGGKSGLINGHGYVYKVSTRAQNYNSGRKTIEFPFVVDNDRPEIVSYTYSVENGDKVLHLKIRDNRYVMGFQIFTADDISVGKVSFKGIDPDESGVYDYTVDVTKMATWRTRNKLDSLKLYVVDYAYNETYGAVDLASDTVNETTIARAVLQQPRAYAFNKDVVVIGDTE